MKRSIVLLEVIVSIILFSIIAIVSSKMILDLVKNSNTNAFITQNNLLLETTRLFLSKQSDFTKLQKRDTRLFFDDNLLLENISQYEVSNTQKIMTVRICIYQDSICQMWKIKK